MYLMDTPANIPGVPLSDYTHTLSKVVDDFTHEPWDSFDVAKALGEKVVKHATEYWGSDDIKKKITNLSIKLLSGLSFDELCKAWVSSVLMFDRSVEDLFENDPQHLLVKKIKSSAWRWGGNRVTWNHLVDAYDGIRAFDLALPGFEIRLDHTTSYNECGYSEHSRTFLDGVFAYLVYHKGKHVMTIGFSIIEHRKLLIQQIQLTERRGNRFLFSMPQNRIEYIVGCFRKAFPDFSLFIVDGYDVAHKSLRSYQSGVDRTLELIEKSKRFGTFSDYELKSQKRWEEDLEIYRSKITHLESDLERLRALYASTGRYTKGEPLKVNNLTHYELAA